MGVHFKFWFRLEYLSREAVVQSGNCCMCQFLIDVGVIFTDLSPQLYLGCRLLTLASMICDLIGYSVRHEINCNVSSIPAAVYGVVVIIMLGARVGMVSLCIGQFVLPLGCCCFL